MSYLVSLTATYGRLLVALLGTLNEWSALLLVGAFALDHLVARRVRASWRIALYLPLALRVLLPQRWAFSLPHAPRVLTILTPVPLDLPPPPEMTLAAPTLGWPAAALAAYLGVALLLAYGIARQRVSARRVLLASLPVTGEVARLSLPCPLVEHAEEGPMVVGLVSPHIVVPKDLLSRGDAATLASVLRHESAHITRGDAWLAAAMQLGLVLFWPVLPLWAASWRVRQLMEIACDESALASADPNERRQYGHALLDLAELRSIGLTPMSAELHFGSTLRARIEALAWTRRWPLALQAGLVLSVAAGFGACSSVDPSSRVAEVTPRTDNAQVVSAVWAPPSEAEVTRTLAENPDKARDIVERYCLPLIERVKEIRVKEIQERSAVSERSARPLAWMSLSTDGLPAEQVAFCRSPKVTELVWVAFWSSEGRNGLGQIGRDHVSAFKERRDRGDPTVCPSAPPLPRELQPPGTAHVQTTPSEWNDGAGFECLHFAFSVPTYFQYRLDNDPTHFAATAHARRTIDGRLYDVTMVLRGELTDGELQVAPNLEETWKVVD
jgi:Zn-dependent protease with chaperone function